MSEQEKSNHYMLSDIGIYIPPLSVIEHRERMANIKAKYEHDMERIARGEAEFMLPVELYLDYKRMQREDAKKQNSIWNKIKRLFT
jgi:hypothetical protein